MSVNDIFKEMASHMIEGMMVHEQLMNSYLFLGLPGYAACHEYHYLSETKGYINLCKYASNHFEIIVPSARPADPSILPESWKNATRSAVTAAMRKEAMIAALREWINWETETVKLYSSFYKELLGADLIPVSEFVKMYILDAEEEIVYAKQELLHKTAMDFDITSILEEQDAILKSFRKRIRKIGASNDEI